MKRTFFLLLAFLALLALAIPSPDAVSSDTIAISSSSAALAPSSVPPDVSGDESSAAVPTTDDLLAEFDRLTGTSATLTTADDSDTSHSSIDDVTTTTKEQFKHLKNWYRVDVRVGIEATHVGTFQGERMYNRMYSILQGCVKGASYDDCSIQNVVFQDSDDNYRTDSRVYLEVEHAYFNPAVPDLQDLGYRMMAKAYQKMTEVPQNCHKIKFAGDRGGDRAMKFCSVASRAMIVYPTNGGPVQMVLKIKLEWDHKTQEDSYACADFTDDGIGEYVDTAFRNEFNNDIARIQKWKADRVTTFVSCYWNGCFYTDPGRNDKVWQEQEVNCEPRWNPRGCSNVEHSRGEASRNCPPEYYGGRTETFGEPGKRHDSTWIRWNPGMNG